MSDVYKYYGNRKIEKVQPEHLDYFNSAGKKMVETLSQNSAITLSKIMDMIAVSTNLYLTIGKTKLGNSFSLTIVFGPDDKEAIYFTSLQEMLVKFDKLMTRLIEEQGEPSESLIEQDLNEGQSEMPF